MRITREELETKVVAIVADSLYFEIKDLTLETRFKEDLNIDSLDMVELVMELEKEFGINVPDDDYMILLTVKSVIDYLETKIQ